MLAGEESFHVAFGNRLGTRKLPLLRRWRNRTGTHRPHRLDHPIMSRLLRTYRELPPEEIGCVVKSSEHGAGALSAWLVKAHGEQGERRFALITLASDAAGNRQPSWEREAAALFNVPPAASSDGEPGNVLLRAHEILLQQELQHRGVAAQSSGYESRLIAWLALQP